MDYTKTTFNFNSTNYGLFCSLMVHNQVVVPQKIQNGLDLKEGDSTLIPILKIDDTKDLQSQIENYEVKGDNNDNEQ